MTEPKVKPIIFSGPDAWDRNDWVVAISFSVIRQNVDEYLKAAI